MAGVRAYSILTVLVGGGIGLGMWHNVSARRGAQDPVTGSVRTAAVPVIGAASGAGGWVSRQVGWLAEGRSIVEENRRLQEENRRLREQVAALTEADVELRRLRAQVGFATMLPRKLPCDVVSLRPDPRFETMVINRGSRDGVRLHSVVAEPLGLVGQVYDVAPTSSAVLLLTDPNSSAGAMVRRTGSRAVGVCKGDGGGLLSLAYLGPEANVKVGDVVISSGLGGPEGVYPKGLVIGDVAAIVPAGSGSGRVVKVRPAVDFSRVEEAYVLVK